jgi:hypothetical protein
MASRDPQIQAHLEWLGFVQPTDRGGSGKSPPPGLVVSPTALVQAGAILPRNDADGQRALRDTVEASDAITDFPAFASAVLGWSFSPRYYAGTDATQVPDELVVTLPDMAETLRPDFAVREREPSDGESPWQLLVRVLEAGHDLDRPERAGGQLEASAHGRMERLLRETGVAAGLLVNGDALRLISAPRGESSGWLEFRIGDMTQTAGRPILAALRLLLNERRMLTLPRAQRLAALLVNSRRYQNEVSIALAEQVLHALYELLRGVQAADRAAGGELLREPLADDPDSVYHALLTVILRMLFVLYADEREMLPSDEVFVQHYSLAGMHERLREDAARHPDTMDQRYGAWAQLLVLFRMVHDGARASGLRMPPRHGGLFDPDRYPFLEGRTGNRQRGERVEPPLVPDGTVLRALEKLLVLGGERLSYRALDVEQIGSVYETMMGFRLERATGRSLAIKAAKRQGAPTAVDLDALLEQAPSQRPRWLAERADRKVPAGVAAAVRAASSVDELHAALLKVADRMATPDLAPMGALVLQPSEERRRSGSHYTPRSLTAPIVRTTLAPVLERLRRDGTPPLPEEILELKVCDPAIGSGAFLVEACRQLADALVEAWGVHGGRPELPPDENEVVYARRLVAQRCLYGVDRNPVAVDLAKLSLWLVTLAREHAFTFLDHALRHGDSLVGLSRRQIEAFHWAPGSEGFATIRIRDHVTRASELRAEIRAADEGVPDETIHGLWKDAQDELRQVRLAGDLVVLAFFSGDKASDRETKRTVLATAAAEGRAEDHRWEVDERRTAEPSLVAFHWEIEFPEVFDRQRPGFDAIVGNPPFAGKNTVVGTNPHGYLDWLKTLHAETHGNADLVAHFFRRGFDLLRDGGAFGLIATNTIAQGDTRTTGLRWICHHGGEVYEARKRVKWPGMAAVVVSVVNVAKGVAPRPRQLDEHEVDRITAFLFHAGGHDDPVRLASNAGQSFIGSYVLGMGFTFDGSDTSGVATPLTDMHMLLADDPANGEVIFPYLGGAEVNDSPTHLYRRYVINFGDRDEDECRRRWPALMAIVEERVKPERDKLADNPDGRRRKRYWWQFGRDTPALSRAIHDIDRVLSASVHTPHLGFAFLLGRSVFSHGLIVFPLSTNAAFCALQSRPHELWARFFGSSMKDDLRYTPSDCFETFPFPEDWTDRADLEAPGRAYYDFRAQLMVNTSEGLTKTYNRFHDPEESDPRMAELRDLHAEMDRAVLDAYGWDDVDTTCEFLLDHEEGGDDSGRRRKPWRYRWPDDVRDDVLARLLKLNGERAAADERSGAAAAAAAARKGKRARPTKQSEALL